jgi:hypothetical protein
MEKEYNLVLKQNDIEDNVLKKDNASVAYIIHQNNNILSKYEEIKNDNEELKRNISELEDDNDRMQKSKVYLQGLAKNYSILAKHRLTIQKHQKKMLFFAFAYICFLQVLSIFLLILQLAKLSMFPFVMIQFASFAYVSVKYAFKEPKHVDFAKKEIGIIEKSNDHINDLIDDA